MVLSFYGLPLNIIRDVYLTARSFITRLRALVRYHNATRDMDRRYPNATEEELAAMSDRTCIICRDELIAVPNNQNNPEQQQAQAPNNAPNANAPAPQDGPNVTPKKLPCGHIFHFQCLRSWLERQQSCPTWLVIYQCGFPLSMNRKTFLPMLTSMTFPAAVLYWRLVRQTEMLLQQVNGALVRPVSSNLITLRLKVRPHLVNNNRRKITGWVG